jgi:hypothetical protein
MPCAPLYYQPFVQAAIRSVPLGKATLGDVANQQAAFRFIAPAPGAERQIQGATEGAMALVTNPQFKAGIEQTMTGIAGLVDARRGARLDGVNMNFSDEGFVASRTLGVLQGDPRLLDTASPDEAAQMTQSIMQRVATSGVSTPVVQGGVLDLPASITTTIGKSWMKQPVSDEEATSAAVGLARALEDAALPIAGSNSWIGSAASLLLSTWNGSASTVSKAMGFANDPAQVERLVKAMRDQELQAQPAAVALHRLLGIAGIDTQAADQLTAARSMLGADAERVPLLMAQGIVAARGIPADKAQWIAGRIQDIGGRPGNVDGLEAELARLAAPVPAPAA